MRSNDSPTISMGDSGSAKTISVAFLATMPILFSMLLILKYYVQAVPLFGPDIISELAIALGVIGLVSLVGTILWKGTRIPKPVVHMFRSAIYEAIGIFGFIVGVAGGDWGLYVPFFVVSLAGLVHALLALRRESVSPSDS